MGTMAESFEDLGDRESAIQWIRDAFESGLTAGWAESRPSLNNLREDTRYKDLIDHTVDRS